MRISDWGSDVCSSDLHCERSEAISSHRRCPTPMAGDCFVAPLLAMTMMSGLVRQQPVLPHRVDDAQFLAGVDVPEGPALAARRPLHPRPALVDRSRGLALPNAVALAANPPPPSTRQPPV